MHRRLTVDVCTRIIRTPSLGPAAAEADMAEVHTVEGEEEEDAEEEGEGEAFQHLEADVAQEHATGGEEDEEDEEGALLVLEEMPHLISALLTRTTQTQQQLALLKRARMTDPLELRMIRIA